MSFPVILQFKLTTLDEWRQEFATLALYVLAGRWKKIVIKNHKHAVFFFNVNILLGMMEHIVEYVPLNKTTHFQYMRYHGNGMLLMFKSNSD